MKKITLTSVIALTLCCPAFATVDITADANSAGCNNTVLHTYTGPTALEADWSANTITLNWYNQSTKITPSNNTANTCTYDGGITLPSNEPTRTGYTFAGWQLRTTANNNNNNQTPFVLTTLDPSIGGTDYGYIELDGSSRSKDTKFGLSQNGEFAAEFSYGFVKGTTSCEEEEENDYYCLCTVTGFDAEKDGTYVPVTTSSWKAFNSAEYIQDEIECLGSCASDCAYFINNNQSFRSYLYGITNYYDPYGE